MRQALTLNGELVKELKSRAGKLGITPSRLAEVYLARGLRSSEPIVLEPDQNRSYGVLSAGTPTPARHPAALPVQITTGAKPVDRGFDPEVGF
jgi:hypothetical protein